MRIKPNMPLKFLTSDFSNHFQIDSEFLHKDHKQEHST